MRSVVRPALLFACLGLVLSGCGENAGDGGASPAAAVPANVTFYAEAIVRPEGRQRDDALAAAGKVLRTDAPSRRLRELVEEALDEGGDGDFRYERDVEPWLGERIGVWAGAVADSPEFVVVAATTDAGEARDALRSAAERSDKRFVARSYKDVEYQVNEEGAAVGVVGDFAATGTEGAFKRTIDAVQGESLAESARYGDAVDRLTDERLAHFYLDLKAFLEAGLRNDPSSAAELDQVKRVLGLDKAQPVVGALMANGERIALDTITSAGAGDFMGRLAALLGNGDVPLLRELPGDAWGALGVPKLGEVARAQLDALAGMLGGRALAGELERETGLKLEEDVFGWIGDAALFVRGERPVEGGLVIDVTNEERAERAFSKIAGLVQSRSDAKVRPFRVPGAEVAFRIVSPDLPAAVVLARGGGRVVAAFGERAAADGFAPATKLGDSEAFGEARRILGGDFGPSFLVSVPAALGLVEPAVSDDPDFARAKPYLEGLSVLAGGSRKDGDRIVQRFAVGLK